MRAELYHRETGVSLRQHINHCFQELLLMCHNEITVSTVKICISSKKQVDG